MNSKLRNTTTRDFIRALESDGFKYVRSRGSHRVYRHSNGRRVIVSYHRPGATFPMKTLATMIAGAGWDEDDLKRLGLIS